MRELRLALDDDTHADLQRLALERRTPTSALILLALDRTFGDDLDRIAGQGGLEDYLKDPSGTVTIEEYTKGQGIELFRETDDNDV